MDTLTGDGGTSEGDLGGLSGGDLSGGDLSGGGVNVRKELFPQSETLAGDLDGLGELGGVTEFRSGKSGDEGRLFVRSINSIGPIGTLLRMK